METELEFRPEPLPEIFPSCRQKTPRELGPYAIRDHLNHEDGPCGLVRHQLVAPEIDK